MAPRRHYQPLCQVQFSTAVAVALIAACASVSALPAATMRQALFFAEQRAGRVGYIGWPPLLCSTNETCTDSLPGSYCADDPTKTPPYFCHEPEVILKDGLAKPVGISVDVATQQVFFAEDDQSGGDTYWPLHAINVDKSGFRSVLPKLLDPQGMDAIGSAKKVFYTEHHGQRVGVVDFDGSNQKVLHTFSGSDFPTDVKVDYGAGKIFVVVGNALTTGQKLATMDLDGGNFKVLKDDIVQAYGLTLNKDDKMVYYINGGHGGFIGKFTYDGKDEGKLLDILDYPYMLDYDPVQKLIVFSEAGNGDGSLKTVTPQGTNVTKSLSLGFAPMGVVFGKVPVA